MFGIDFGDAGSIFTIGVVYAGMVVAALWLAIILWTYRDMRARSRDTLAQILVAVMVAVLTLPGLLIYVFLRPRETLSEAYERSLEEEALLQEIEEKPSCPGCGQRVQDSWQVCAYCHTRLKKPCINCNRLLELPWNLCPYCATVQGNYDDVDYLPTANANTGRVSLRREDPAAYSTESIEFVDGDEF